MTQKSKQPTPWFADKRAQAFLYVLLADRDVLVRDQPKPDLGIDLIIHLTKNGHETGRAFAAILKPYLDLPSLNVLSKEIAGQIPRHLQTEWMLPVVAFVVQVRHLDAVYAWISEPGTENGCATLRPPIEFEWRKLDDDAMTHILRRVEEFWVNLLKPALNGSRK